MLRAAAGSTALASAFATTATFTAALASGGRRCGGCCRCRRLVSAALSAAAFAARWITIESHLRLSFPPAFFRSLLIVALATAHGFSALPLRFTPLTIFSNRAFF